VGVTVGYHWHLRRVMAERGMYATTDLGPLLAERGVRLSREQVYRLATKTPQRLNLHVLAALCDILECSPDALIEPYRGGPSRRPAGTSERPSPLRARITGE
jgi:DNA-binding Xre family transcriptional regulator